MGQNGNADTVDYELAKACADFGRGVVGGSAVWLNGLNLSGEYNFREMYVWGGVFSIQFGCCWMDWVTS